jgi:hypothetical protein
MRKLTEAEVVALNEIVVLEYDGLAMSRAMKELIVDDDLKKQFEAGILQNEQRLKGLLQFINENDILEPEEDEDIGEDTRKYR